MGLHGDVANDIGDTLDGLGLLLQGAHVLRGSRGPFARLLEAAQAAGDLGAPALAFLTRARTRPRGHVAGAGRAVGDLAGGVGDGIGMAADLAGARHVLAGLGLEAIEKERVFRAAEQDALQPRGDEGRQRVARIAAAPKADARDEPDQGQRDPAPGRIRAARRSGDRRGIGGGKRQQHTGKQDHAQPSARAVEGQEPRHAAEQGDGANDFIGVRTCGLRRIATPA
ncbi:hypothetical protein [Dyella sp.]|uniref:hypothetical protein n=1 Tax=Dyella sp. TaxID=1869338 RepID=UPI003F80BFAA